jgi:hypothetical protein
LKILKLSVVANSLLESVHQFQVILFVLRIQLTIAVLGVTMVADRQLGISQGIPVEAHTSRCETNAIGIIGGACTHNQINKSQGFPSIVANIKMFPATNHALVDHVLGLV